jgi:hypothetical protein
MARKVFDDTHISASADTIRNYLNTTDKYTTSQMPQAILQVYYQGDSDGYTRGFNEGEKYGNESGYETGLRDGRIEGYNEGYTEGKNVGYTEGQTAEYNKFWDKLQRQGRRTEYRYAFYSWYWNNTIYVPKYPIICPGVSTDMMRYSEISDTVVPITVTHANSQYLFANNTYLKTIRELNVTASVNFVGWFAGCTALENITFGEGSVIGQNIDFSACPLTRESVANIVAHLGTVTSAKTLTLGAANKALLTDSEIAEILAKGWTIA